MRKMILVWILALAVTLGSAYYQRLTGPSHPKRIEFSVDGQIVKQKLLRSQGGKDDAKITLKLDNSLVAELYFRHYPIMNEDWTKVSFNKVDDEFVALLPNQPPAGKLQYYIDITQNETSVFTNVEDPVVIRFKGAVPDWILVVHIFLMFSTMLIANVSGVLAVLKDNRARVYTFITLGLLAMGGMVFGPIVQKYAFGEFWTGIPKGWDLTDNKTLIAFGAWIIAVIMNLKKVNFTWPIIAAVITLVIFAIPHSMFGSTLNRETGDVIQGFVFFIVLLGGKESFKRVN
ncbi:MAG: hypothetical protein KAI79_03605 [Bacteroidales bacterium]|nr:hypothetical protein [Bacteroidales bacterium]